MPAKICSSSTARMARAPPTPSPISSTKAGTYYRARRRLPGKRQGRHFYRIKVGSFRLVTSAFPLGVQKGKTAEVTLSGYDLPAARCRCGEPSRRPGKCVSSGAGPKGPRSTK